MREIYYYGKPVGKARHRVGRYGNTYTPQNTVDFEESIAWSYKGKYSDQMQGALKVNINISLKPPKSTSKKMKKLMLAGMELPTKKPDVDNIAKSILDGLNKVAYEDDKQVVDLEITKRYGLEDVIHVVIEKASSKPISDINTDIELNK